MSKKKIKGGDSIKQYTPLIKAIQQRDEYKVRRLLNAAGDISPEKAREVANEKDDTYGWSPLKWANFMYLHGPNHDNRNNQISCNIIGELLIENGADLQVYLNTPPDGVSPPIDEILRGYSEENNNNRNEYSGGSISTEEDRITYAMDGNYTPLINAINRGNIEEVRRLLETGADPNQRDNVRGFNWCPFKWAAFARRYGGGLDGEDYDVLISILREHGATTCYDDNHVRENSYNYSPVITDIDEQLEQLRIDAEEDNMQNTRNTTGGTRRRKNKKSRKHKKTHKNPNKKNKRTLTKKRKHIKK